MSNNTNTTLTDGVNFYLVQSARESVIVGHGATLIDTTGMSRSQTEVADQLNDELRSELSLLAFGEVGASVLPASFNPRKTAPKLPRMRQFSPVGAHAARQLARELVVPELVEPVQRRAINNLRNNPHWTVRDCVMAAAEKVEELAIKAKEEASQS